MLFVCGPPGSFVSRPQPRLSGPAAKPGRCRQNTRASMHWLGSLARHYSAVTHYRGPLPTGPHAEAEASRFVTES